jgi:hypothetical protein
MSPPYLCLVLLTLCALTCVDDAEAQILQRIRERRAALLAPPVDPAPAPEGEAPPAAEPPLRGGFLARRLQMRRDLVAQQEALAQPTPATPAPQQAVAAQQAQQTARRRPLDALRQASAQLAPALRNITRVELAEMDVPDLQTALANTNGSLGNELSQFTSAASWQEFFQLPAGIVDAGTIDLAALQTLFVRFENVAANPKYAQIAALPSFQQSRTLLAELVNRADPPQAESPAIDGPQLIDPASDTQLSAESSETLPAPEPRLPRNSGEHSILLRKGS